LRNRAVAFHSDQCVWESFNEFVGEEVTHHLLRAHRGDRQNHNGPRGNLSGVSKIYCSMKEK
jgi:hypothetical protein